MSGLGVRSCDAEGWWDACLCEGECLPGSGESCSPVGECVSGLGRRTCGQDGWWESCGCTGECRPGDVEACDCGTETATRTCGVAGWWGGCNCPLPELLFSECTDGLDNDDDGRIDRADDCTLCPPLAQRTAESSSDATCRDGIDNDCNGYVDCNDFACTKNRPRDEFGTPTITSCCPLVPTFDEMGLCANGRDDDCDGNVDCLDGDCAIGGPCCPAGATAESGDVLCADGIDNDCDGRTDCADADCRPAGASVCCPEVREAESGDARCRDGIDNDCDGYVDCVDLNCQSVSSPQTSVCQELAERENGPLACHDGVDNDGDNQIDCVDPSCRQDPAATDCLCSPALPFGACADPEERCQEGSCVVSPFPRLFFSEYLEGSGDSKAVEIYNPAADNGAGLIDCAIRIYYNGAGASGTVIGLAEVELGSGETFVVCNSKASAGILAACDQTSGVLNYSGDDAVELVCRSMPLDVIGQIGVDPGEAWISGTVTTKDRTLRRACGIVQGDPSGADPFDPALQWTVHDNGTFDGLGTHDPVCP